MELRQLFIGYFTEAGFDPEAEEGYGFGYVAFTVEGINECLLLLSDSVWLVPSAEKD